MRKINSILTDQLAERKTGGSTPYELTWRRKDGSVIYSVISPMPLFEDGQQLSRGLWA